MNSGAWNEPKEEIKTRSVPPMQLVVNGKKIFMKGSNWLSPEVFPAKVSDETYDILTDYAVELNFNIFRMWGDAPVAREKFFELCDQKGIMVWQEFTMACNQYPDDEAYLKVLEQEAVSIIKRLRKHPSLTRWTCGNELFNGWSCMTEQSLALRTLDALTLRLSPQIPFNFTSPVMGVGHGPYYFLLPKLKPAEDMFQVFARSRFTLYCEFGISSMSPIETIKKIIPENERFPVRQSPAWATHHAYKSTTPNPYFDIYDVHCNKRVVSLIFGEPKTLEEHIENSQFLQAQGYKFIFEETRRQKPYCSGGINWCYNDAWESAANQSIIAYPHIKKPAFEAVKAACRPFLFSAKPEKFTWKAGEIFPLQIFALNDSHDTFEPMKVVVKAIFDGKEQLVGNWTSKSVKPYSNLEDPKFEIKIPNMGDKVKRFKIVVEAEGRKEYSSEYEFVYNPRLSFKKPQKNKIRTSFLTCKIRKNPPCGFFLRLRAPKAASAPKNKAEKILKICK